MNEWESNKILLIGRLKRAEGQIRGIQKIILEEKDDEKLVQQLAAIRGALDKIFFIAIGEKIKKEIVGKSMKTKKIDDFVDFLKKYG